MSGNVRYAKTEHYLIEISMILLDTNIFIYFANGTLSTEIIAKTDICHSSITKIEALGLSTIPANELLILSSLFNESYDMPLTESIVNRAVNLRQAKSMNLGDAIIAATALEHYIELWTVNVEDFKHIEGLKIVNPLQ